MATLFDRISLIVRSKTSALVEKFEDPAEVIDQVIVDAKKDYSKCKAESGPVLANEKKAKETLQEYRDAVDKWNRIAEAAVMDGGKDADADATRALENAAEYEAKVVAQEKRYEEARKDADALRKKLNDMAEQIREMEAKSAEIKADMANAKAAETTAKVSGKIGSNSFAEFDRLAEKAANRRREAEALNEFDDNPAESADRDLEAKYSGAGTSPVSDSLAELKNRLGKA